VSQAPAFANGWNLATTLIICVVVFHADDGDYGVMPADRVLATVLFTDIVKST
jgi:hypothetical protein